MDWNQVEGKGKEFRGKVKEKWGKLTDDDLTAIKANAISWKVGFNSDMVLRRIRFARTLIVGFLPSSKLLIEAAVFIPRLKLP